MDRVHELTSRPRRTLLRRNRRHRRAPPLRLDDELIEAIVRELNIAVDEHVRIMKERWKKSLYCKGAAK